MATKQVCIEIACPIKDVFEFVSEIENLNKWTPVIVNTWALQGTPPELGSRYMVKARIAGRTMEIPSEVIGFEKNKLFAYRSLGSMGYDNEITFETTDTGTRMTECIQMPSSGGLAAFLTPLKIAIAGRSHAKSQAVLKELLESG